MKFFQNLNFKKKKKVLKINLHAIIASKLLSRTAHIFQNAFQTDFHRAINLKLNFRSPVGFRKMP